MKLDMKRELSQGLWIGGGIALIALALVIAKKAGWVGSDMPMRFSVALTGLFLAFYANTIPKAVFRSVRTQKLQRFSGWVFMTTGLAYAALWLFAPMPIAMAAMGVIAAGLVAVIGYCFLLRRAERATPNT